MDTCINPPELEDGQLLIYLDGEAGPAVTAHVDACGYCRGRAQGLAGFQNGLARKLHRVDCPGSFELGEFQLGKLRGAERQEIADHIAICPNCRKELSQWLAFVAATDERRQIRPGGLERIRVLIADLISGGSGGLSPAVVGLRGEEAGPLIFGAGTIRIAMRSRSSAGRPPSQSLIGLITGEDPSGFEVLLRRDGEQVARTTVDELGNFRFEAVLAGNYSLIIAGGEMEIHVQEVMIE